MGRFQIGAITRPLQQHTILSVLILTIALAMLGLAPGSTAAAQQDAPAVLAFSPIPGALRAGEQLTYSLTISNAQRLFGADIEIAFDPAVATVGDADLAKDGVQAKLGPFLDPGFVVYNVADNAAGKLRVTFTQVAPKAPANGSGAILSLELRATTAGDPKLRVTAALLARNDGTPQPVTILTTGGPGPIATAAPPQGSPIPNPTPPPALVATATPSTGASATASQAAATPAGAASPVPTPKATSLGSDDSADDAPNWTLVAVIALLGLATGVAAVFGRRYIIRRNRSDGGIS